MAYVLKVLPIMWHKVLGSKLTHGARSSGRECACPPGRRVVSPAGPDYGHMECQQAGQPQSVAVSIAKRLA